MNIDSIQNGYVIDHIKAGKSFEIYNYLSLDNLDTQVAIIKNARSEKCQKKDIIKIDINREINLDILGYLDSNITINKIQNGRIIKKYHPKLPEQLVNVIKCKNPRCITSTEQGLPHICQLTNRDKKVYRCKYCDGKVE